MEKSPCVGLGSLSIFIKQQVCAVPVAYTVLAPRPYLPVALPLPACPLELSSDGFTVALCVGSKGGRLRDSEGWAIRLPAGWSQGEGQPCPTVGRTRAKPQRAHP